MPPGGRYAPSAPPGRWIVNRAVRGVSLLNEILLKLKVVRAWVGASPMTHFSIANDRAKWHSTIAY
jgi:hypothetical protein